MGLNDNSSKVLSLLPRITPEFKRNQQNGAGFKFELTNKNYLQNVQEKNVFTTIVIQGDPFFLQTRLEIDNEFLQSEATFNNVRENSGNTEMDFEIVTSCDMKRFVEYFKTLERIEAKGSAKYNLAFPAVDFDAKFSLKAPQTSETADCEVKAKIQNFADFHISAFADQYFDLFPLVSIWGLDIIGDLKNLQKSTISMTVTRDDSYTTEVEKYDTVLSLDVGDLIQNTIPEHLLVNLKVPDFIFGRVPYNDNSVGYRLNAAKQSGECFIMLIPKGEEADSKDKKAAKFTVGLITSPNIIIKLDCELELGTDQYIVKQAININDNGIRIGQQGIQNLKISLIDLENEIYLKYPGSQPVEMDFKFRLENQDRTFGLQSALSPKSSDENIFKFKFLMMSSEDTAVSNRKYFDEMKLTHSSLMVDVLKVVKTSLDPFFVGAGEGIYKTVTGTGMVKIFLNINTKLGAKFKYASNF